VLLRQAEALSAWHFAAQMQDGVRTSHLVTRRTAHHDESERFVETARRGILLVDIDTEATAAELLRVRDQKTTVPSSVRKSWGSRTERSHSASNGA